MDDGTTTAELWIITAVFYGTFLLAWFVACFSEWHDKRHWEHDPVEARRWARRALAAPLWPVICAVWFARWLVRSSPAGVRDVGRMVQDAFSRK